MTEQLTQREWLVWCLWSNGASRRQIAESLTVSPTTVSTYTTRISRKLGVSGWIEASAADVCRPT